MPKPIYEDQLPCSMCSSKFLCVTESLSEYQQDRNCLSMKHLGNLLKEALVKKSDNDIASTISFILQELKK